MLRQLGGNIVTRVKNKVDAVGMMRYSKPVRKVYITMSEVLKLKKLLDKKLVLSIKDKNIGQLRVECPLRLYERLKKEIYHCKVFIRVGMKYNDILKKFKNIYNQNNMITVGRW